MQRDRALNHLAAIRRDLARLTALERSWFDDAFMPDDRIGYRAAWDNTLDRFTAVVDAHASGRLDRDITEQIVEVAQALAVSTPMLERMQLRQAFAESLGQQVDLLRRSRCDGNWNVAAMRLKGLAASFHAEGLIGFAEEALDAAPGDPVVIRKLERFLTEFTASES